MQGNRRGTSVTQKLSAEQILIVMSEDKELCAMVLNALSLGMMDEWDCTLSRGLEIFGEDEIALAAKTGAIIASNWND